MSSEIFTESFVESALLPSVNHERIPIFYDTVDLDTIDEVIVYIRSEGLRNPDTLLGKEDVSQEFIKGAFGIFAPQVFANKREVAEFTSVEINGTKIAEVFWQTGEIKKLLYESSIKRIKTGSLVHEYQLLNEEVHFTSKSAITVLEWTPRCRPCKKCRENWCEFRRRTITHELAHRRHLETMVDNINHRWQKRLKTPIEAVSSDEALEKYWKGLSEILDEERNKCFAKDKHLHLQDALAKDLSLLEQTCSCAVVEDGDPCLQNEPKLIKCPSESWLEGVAEWDLEIEYESESGVIGYEGNNSFITSLVRRTVTGLFGTRSMKRMKAKYSLKREFEEDGGYVWTGAGKVRGKVTREGGLFRVPFPLIVGRGRKRTLNKYPLAGPHDAIIQATDKTIAETEKWKRNLSIGDLLDKANQTGFQVDEQTLVEFLGEDYEEHSLAELIESSEDFEEDMHLIAEIGEDVIDNAFTQQLGWADVTDDSQQGRDVEPAAFAEDSAGWYSLIFPGVVVREFFLPLPLLTWKTEFGGNITGSIGISSENQEISGGESFELFESGEWEWTLTPKKFSDEPWPKYYGPSGPSRETEGSELVA